MSLFIMLKSILLTLGSCATLLAVLSALASPDSWGVDSSESITLPPEIVAAEAEYEIRQQAIETAIRRLTLSTLELPPEERRARIVAGLEELRPVLLDQQAGSDAIDLLYEQHLVPEEPGPLEVLAAQAPKDAEGAASTQGRRWALDYDLARLRHDLAGDPESLRTAMLRWNEENAEAVLAMRGGPVFDASADHNLVTRPTTARLEAPAGATGNLRLLISLQNDFSDIAAQYPPPVLGVDSTTPSLQEMELWRDTVYAASAALVARLSPLLQEFDQETNRWLARQYSDEQNN